MITYATALALAELVLREHFGSDAYDLQAPLSVDEDGEFWLVRGAWTLEREPVTDPLALRTGVFQMRIAQSDGQIVSILWGHPPL